jgi:hypothetical protein
VEAFQELSITGLNGEPHRKHPRAVIPLVGQF